MRRQRSQLVTIPATLSRANDSSLQLLNPQQRDPAARPLSPENALAWALAKVDRQLDQIEADPPALLKASYEVANGPVGVATNKGVQAAAKLTMAATVQAVKAAAPVGSWALKEGFKVASRAAVGLVALALEQQGSRQASKTRAGKKGSAAR